MWVSRALLLQHPATKGIAFPHLFSIHNFDPTAIGPGHKGAAPSDGGHAALAFMQNRLLVSEPALAIDDQLHSHSCGGVKQVRVCRGILQESLVVRLCVT